MKTNNLFARLFRIEPRMTEEPIDGFWPAEHELSRRLTKLKLEQGRAMAANEMDRARAIHRERVRLYKKLQETINHG